MQEMSNLFWKKMLPLLWEEMADEIAAWNRAKGSQFRTRFLENSLSVLPELTCKIWAEYQKLQVEILELRQDSSELEELHARNHQSTLGRDDGA
jgi:hypothetical protein